MSYFITLNLIPVGHDLSLLGWQPASASNPPPHQSYRCMAMLSFTCGCLEFELGSSCLYSKCFYPLSHLPAPVSTFDGDSDKELSALFNRS